jgi:glycogen operon protein
MRILPGRSYPLGAHYDGSGVNFALFSEHARSVELCLFYSVEDECEYIRLELPTKEHHVWSGYVPGVKDGQLYAYRVYGPFDSKKGLLFNPHKLLLDPYARLVARDPKWDESFFPYERMGEQTKNTGLMPSDTDSAPYAPLGMVVDPAWDWQGDARPEVPWADTVLYEAHIKGLSKLHPEVDPELRGTYLGLASKPIIDHLKSLNVTSVEILPIHHHFVEEHLSIRDLTNYWGYNTLSYFAPDLRYGTNPKDPLKTLDEFRQMVMILHKHGLEVILDVVYNHTCEGTSLGPMLSLKGIDNSSYYRLDTSVPQTYVDYTGCGNTLDMRHPRVLQLVMDSLRYWVEELHVDGFRFDLATALAREDHAYDPGASFLDAVQQDPVLSRVKLISEPWDIGDGGYQVGGFPVNWYEWNGQYRDSIRRYWRGDSGSRGDVSTRIAGSSDLYQHNGRRPQASINFVTCHDGFSLVDLVSYNSKRNEQNGEDNRDGNNDNMSWNCGHEGKTTDPEVLALRLRQRKNFMFTMAISLGVPMLRAGDELGQTQGGNNNAYCQDNELSWLHWDLDSEQSEFLNYVRSLFSIRNTSPIFKRTEFFTGLVDSVSGRKDVAWYSADGQELDGASWNAPESTLGICLSGAASAVESETGQSPLLVLLNPEHISISFSLPRVSGVLAWRVLIDTYSNGELDRSRTASNESSGMELHAAEDTIELPARSAILFRALLDEDM